jgi:hypothetical protein
MQKVVNCKACGQSLDSYHPRTKYCSSCRTAPVVYSYTAPDGRVYVGSVIDSRYRAKKLGRSNTRLLAVFKQYPRDSFVYKVLERMPRDCSACERHEAEQRHMDRLQSWSPEKGFNILPAVDEGDGPAQQAARQFRLEVIAGVHERARRHMAECRRRDAEWRRAREVAGLKELAK